MMAEVVVRESRGGWHASNGGTDSERWWFTGGGGIATQLRDQLRSQTQKHFIEVLVFVLVVWYIGKCFYGSNKKISRSRSSELTEQIILEWKPEPIVPELSPEQKVILSRVPVVVSPGKGGRELNLSDGNSYLEMSSFNFQGLCNLDEINEVAIKKLRTHGVGTCGPRGFYGTMDVHLDLEKMLTNVFKTEKTILYSQSLSANTSTHYAFIRKGDFVVADEMMSFGQQKGLHTAVRANTLHLFNHNDMEDLERLMKSVSEQCKISSPNARKILTVEAIYRNTGEICPLKTVVELKDKYDFFLFLDESYSFGVLGKTGLGALEYWDLDPSRVDIIIGSLATTFASSGGFAAGKQILIDYLHLSGKSYTFSASTPSLLVTAASHAITYFFERSENLSAILKENCILMHNLLQPLSETMNISKSLESPIIHVTPKDSPTSPEDAPRYEVLLSDVVSACKDDGVLFTLSRYSYIHELNFKPPSIRITVSSIHTKQDLTKAAESLIKHLGTHFSSPHHKESDFSLEDQ